MIQDPLLVFAYLAALVALVFQVARRQALRPLFDRLPALVWTYFLPMLSTTAGILPAESPVYRAIARYLLPASLSLLLLSSELKAIARLGRTALVVMTVGMAGIMLGGVACILGAGWFASRLPRIRELVRPIYVRQGIIPAPVESSGA